MFLGNRFLVNDAGIILSEETENNAAALESEGKTILFLANQNRLLGAVAVADVIKDRAAESIKLLHDLGIEVWMITGDNSRAAYAIGRQLGVKKENIISQVLPKDKAEAVRKFQIPSSKFQKHIVAFVGDGINDAPALTQADVGIAIGTGTDIAIESSDITLISGDPLGIYEAIKLSRRTLRNIKQNLFWAYIYNVILIPVAAGVLWPWGILMNPMLAGGAMAFSSVSVVLNSLRLKKLDLSKQII